ncbi:hypothetical protein ECC02_010584 [Trypanosoma cruzi]|uniref:Mucin TcMUCII n=1 Tax=Trypanosoma cruzi TaxID=5693 RepID=A0A7J6XQ98_TRYCR|nr:hypothetical protein ECC02_010584 [Trypanosoma cruzi]
MMTTCRLLCALLVLALCCCPSVCAEETPKDTEAERSEQHQFPPALAGPQGASQSLSPSTVSAADREDIQPGALESGEHVTSHSGSPIILPSAEKGKVGEEGPISEEAASALQKQGDKGTTGSQSGQSISEEQADKNSEALSKTTTTTTTQAPTTTTTTTTAPEPPSTTTTEASSTTNTEAPAVSTTRAPSRLREVDGSLSGSAWVCAPLLLAASALACTTLC